MLEAVGNPVAVNPDRQLRRLAEERGWPVLEFDRPVALGERVPLGSQVGGVTALTLALALVVWVGVRRTPKASSGDGGLRHRGQIERTFLTAMAIRAPSTVSISNFFTGP